MTNTHTKEQKEGVISTITAYLLWGILPLYWNLMSNVSAVEILANRIIWSLVFTMFFIMIQSKWSEIKKSFNSLKEIQFLIYRSIFIGCNWLTFVWAVNNNRVLECSLGYYINPLTTVLLGYIFLKEKLNRFQIISLFLTVIAVSLLVLNYGKLPWVSIIITVTFAFYSLFKKTTTIKPLPGLAAEAAVLTPPALIYLAIISFNSGQFYFEKISITDNILLLCSGIATAIPLLLFAYGIKKIRMTTIGLLQYIAPSCTFLLGIFIFKENYTGLTIVAFLLIWVSIVIFSWKAIFKKAV